MTDAEFEERTKTRQEEIQAVSQALAILSSDDAHDTFTSTFNFVQVSQKEESKRQSAEKIMYRIAKASGNPRVATLATRMRLDGFKKVTEEIDGMIADLKKEKADDVKMKDFCIEALHKNEVETEMKKRDIAALEAKIEDLKAHIDELTKAIATLNAEVEETHMMVKRAGEDRELENKDFQQVVADQRETQKLLSQALLLAVELAGCGFHAKESHRYENDALRVQRETHGSDERTRNQKGKNTEDIVIV